MYMKTLPGQGIPPRGSLRDLIATEMVQRERRAEVASNTYIARILQLQYNVPPKIFDVWTQLYAAEVFQESYSPANIEAQRKLLESFDRRKIEERKQRSTAMSKLKSLEVTSDNLRPVTKEEREEFKRKLRNARMKRKVKK